MVNFYISTESNDIVMEYSLVEQFTDAKRNWSSVVNNEDDSAVGINIQYKEKSSQARGLLNKSTIYNTVT